MPSRKTPRKGSLQFWPRKRANKFLPSVNWDAINSENTEKKGLKGFICYKAGMISGFVKDETNNSMMKGKKITIPMTVLECPPMKILSIRLYKNGIVKKEILAENLDKELKRKIKLPKNKSKLDLEKIKLDEFDNLRLIVYSVVKKSGLKKSPDISEIGLTGNLHEKFEFAKKNFNKEITISEVFEKGQLIDLRGLTKGKGFQGVVKRFGVKLRFHKTEKGQRKVGSIGPWNPPRVTFRVPMPGQMGMFTRAIYNGKIIDVSKASEKPINSLKNYGNVNTDYVLVYGSVQGSAKRQLIATSAMRPTKKQLKKNYELINLR
ncbi:MAG: 50S ribosomal protein L3 [Candidatus Pacearchaeota archaeon]|jgi:large subunit ribosomal protein L3